jgi:hypothetical protein
VPVALAAIVAVVTVVALSALRERGDGDGDVAGPRRGPLAMLSAATLGLALGWGAGVHVTQDVLTALRIRAVHQHYADILERHLGREPTALFAYFSAVVPFAPLQLGRSLLVCDPGIDKGRTARALSAQLLDRGFRVLVLPQRMPEPIAEQLLAGRSARAIEDTGLVIVELAP